MLSDWIEESRRSKVFSKFLRSMLPRIKLTDLLLEVTSWDGYHNQFIHASTD